MSKLKVISLKQIEVRPFYDSTWEVEFKGGEKCKVVRYDTDTTVDLITELEKCSSVEEVKSKVDVKDKIYYD